MLDTTYTLLPWNGGHANVTAANTERTAAPMTPLAKGSGPDRVSADGQYRYLREDQAWWVQHLPSGQWITHLSGLTIGFTSCATARRWTASDSPVPDGRVAIPVADLIAETRQAMARLAAIRTNDEACDWCVVGKPCTCRADSTDPLDY